MISRLNVPSNDDDETVLIVRRKPGVIMHPAVEKWLQELEASGRKRIDVDICDE